MIVLASKKRNDLLFSGVVILTFANILVKVIGLLYKIPLHNLLGDEGMGYFNAAYKIYTMFYMVSTAGLPVAVSIMISSARTKGNRNEVKMIFKSALTLFLVIGALGTSIMMIGSHGFAGLMKNDPAYVCILAIAPTLFFICICSAIRGYFQGYQNMLPTAVSEVLESLGKFILGILFATYAMNKGYSLPVVAAFALLGLTIGVVVGTLYIVIHRVLFKSEEYDAEFVVDNSAPVRKMGQIIKALFAIAIPISISSSVMSVADAIDSIVIQRTLQTVSYTAKEATALFGNYSTLAVSLYNLPPVLIYPISCAIVPYISSALAENDKEKAKGVMTSSLKIASLISIPSALGLSVLSKPILGLLFSDGESVKKAAPLLSVLAIAVFFVGMLSVTNAILQANRHERMPIISMISGAVVKVSASYLFMRFVLPSGYEMFGAPIGTVFCYMTIAILNFIFISKKIGLVPNFTEVFAKPFFAAVPCAVMAMLTYVLLDGVHEKIATLAAIAVAILVYLIAVLLFKAITKEEILMIPKGKKIYGLLHKLKLM
ncbi:MAG: polysaccharide biosynthesis protein [Ruminococcaceae bacterium]|nr:polysaccharide biosynthesis protein [Oscillospiraceae bacterium]